MASLKLPIIEPDPPYILLPFQQAWLADESEIKVYEKSRQIGISWSEACGATLEAARTNGKNVWYVSYNKDMALEFISDAATWARQFQSIVEDVFDEDYVDVLPDGNTRNILAFVIKFASGHKITALSSRPSNMRGKRGIVIIDEAAFHDSLEELIAASLALTQWGGKVRILSTHNTVDNYFYELIQHCRSGALDYKVYRTDFKEAVEQGLYKRICLKNGWIYSAENEAKWIERTYKKYLDKARASEELDVIPRSGSDVYLTRALIEAVMQPNIPIVRLALENSFLDKGMDYRESWMQDWCATYLKPVLTTFNSHLNHFLGADFARSGDLTVIWILEEQKDLHLSTPLVVELRNIPFTEQEQLILYLCKRIPKFMSGAVDGRGNGGQIAEALDSRYSGIFYRTNNSAGVYATAEFYRQAMPRMKARFEDKSLTIPRDSDILADLRSVVLDKGVAKVPEGLRLKDTSGGFRHGDAAIALLLAIWASIQEVSIYAYHSAIYPSDSTQNNYQNFLRPPPDEDRPVSGSGIKTSVTRWRD